MLIHDHSANRTLPVGSGMGRNTRAPVTQNRLTVALAELRRAAGEKKPGSICSAYLGLRSAANGMKAADLLSLADEVLDNQASDLIVSAFSHWHCFMCDRGTVSCDQCGPGHNTNGRRQCPDCAGLGVAACKFCGGTGWADRETLPKELLARILGRQFVHVRNDLKQFAAAIVKLNKHNVRHLGQPERHLLAAWGIRLRARLRELSRTNVIVKTEQSRLMRLADKVGDCLSMLKSSL